MGRAWARANSAKPLNIIFIMADDLGYADLGCYGAREIKTPHLDRLAKHGVRLTQGYANSPVCSATRMALITGQYQYRYRAGLEEPIRENLGLGLPETAPSLAAQMRKAGYRTALVGKWHLGDIEEFGPLKRGYDRFYGIPAGGVDYFRHSVILPGFEEHNLLTEGDQTVDENGYLTDLLGDRAATEIEEAGRDDVPLFLSLHFTAPHWPWEGPEDEAVSKAMKNYLHLDGGNLKTYTRMVESMDANVGKVIDALKRADRFKDTLIIFTSDNGGERFSDTWPFVGSKTELLEGGIRVPLIAHWPRRIRSASVSDQIMTSMDFMPTLLSAAGAPPEAMPPTDGENLLDVLLGEVAPKPRKLFWRYKSRSQAAIRDGDWKYLKITDREYLFNLAQDERERADLRYKYPERFEQLKQEFSDWNETMLAYPEDSLSHAVSSFYPDRYEPEESIMKLFPKE